VTSALFLLLFAAAPAVVPPPAAVGEDQRAAVFARAAEHYRKGEYGAAIGDLEAVIASGPPNGHLHYDLGNAYLKSGQVGPAIGHYLTAQRLLPRDEDLAANLEHARKKVTDKVEPPRPRAFLRTAFFWSYVLSARELVLGLAIALGALFGLVIVRMLRGAAWAVWGAVAAGVMATAFGGGLLGRLALAPALGVVQAAEVEVRTGPERGATTVFRLHSGVELEITDAEGEWLKIQLSDGKRGWLRAEEVFRVRMRG
jgi:tetratricopeptide (TPR) repeat protein